MFCIGGYLTINCLVYTKHEHSKTKHDKTFCQDLFVFKHLQSGTFCDENNIPSLRSQSWVMPNIPR